MDNIHGKYLQPLQNCRENVPEWFGGQIGIKNKRVKPQENATAANVAKRKG